MSRSVSGKQGCLRLGNASRHQSSRRGYIGDFSSQNGLVRQLGYTRVSTSSQDAKLQLDALVTAGVQKRDVFADVTSGSKTAIHRPGMRRFLEYAEEGDTVVVRRVDRLGRSLIEVLNTVTLLRPRHPRPIHLGRHRPRDLNGPAPAEPTHHPRRV